MPDGDMDTGTKIVIFLAAIIGLASAVIAYRTAKLKHDNEASGLGSGKVKQQPGPLDNMFAIIGAFGSVLGPILLFMIVFAVGKIISAIPSSFQFSDHPASSQPAEMIDRKLLNPREIRLFDLAETAAGMSGGRSRSEALRHVVDLAIGEKVYSIALVAAARMGSGRDRDEALESVALSAVKNNDAVTANNAIRAMATGRARDDAAREVMAILEKQKLPSQSAPPAEIKK